MILIYDRQELFMIVARSNDIDSLFFVQWYMKEHSELYCETTALEIEMFARNKTDYIKWFQRR